MVIRIATMFVLLASSGAIADTEIYRCTLDDGTFAFQEMPCPEPVDIADDEPLGDNDPAQSGDEPFDFVNPFDEPANAPEPAETMPPEPVTQDRAECEKMTRDAIDSIDREMRAKSYSKEQGQVYLAELRTLTQQLRACKQL